MERAKTGGSVLRWQKRKPIRHWDDSKFRRSIQSDSSSHNNVRVLAFLHALQPGELISFCQWWQIAVVVVNSFSVIQRFLFSFIFVAFLMNAKRIAILNEILLLCSARSYSFNSREKQILSNHKKITNRLHIKSIYWMLSVYSDIYVHTKSMNWWCSPMFAFCRT